jgi:polar amino acid transport system substrate-binding protein
MKRIGRLGICICFLILVCSAHAGSLEQIRQRGKIIIGVKSDVPLWGYLDPASKTIQGLDPDLGHDLADRLGVGLELIGLQTAERVEAVASGRVDLLIATLSDTPERRQQMTLVLPHYYSSGTNILARRSEHFKTWDDFRHRTVCGRRGAFYNRQITVKYGIDIVALYSNALSLSALRDGRCAALLYEDTAIIAMLTEPEWAKEYEMPLPTILSTPWSIALAPGERGGELEKAVSQIVIAWHRDGYIRQLEQKRGIPETRYVTEMHHLWSRKVAGKWFCGDEINAATPEECK